MRLRLASRGVELSPAIKDFLTRRIRFSLGRFASSIRSLSVHLADANGPRGGVDKSCGILIDAGLRQPVFVRDTQPGICAAIAGAFERAARAIRHQLKHAGMTKGA